MVKEYLIMYVFFLRRALICLRSLFLFVVALEVVMCSASIHAHREKKKHADIDI